MTLFVGFTAADAAAAGTTLVEVAELLAEFARDAVPTAETHAVLTLVGPGQGLPVAPPPAAGNTSRHSAGLQLLRHERRVLVDGVPAVLTRMEFELLAFLMSHPRRAFGRDELLTRVWGMTYPVGTRTVDTHVARLRAKLSPHGHHLVTVRGSGYRFE